MALNPTVTIVYVFPVHELGFEHYNYAVRFMMTLHDHPAGYPAKVLIVSNGGPASLSAVFLMEPLQPAWIVHDDSGWDVGAFLEAARHVDTEAMFCMGGPSYVRKEGWLNRVVQAWNWHGPGMYGTISTYEVRAHLNTSGFLIPTRMMREYPEKVVNRRGRYEFEHGPDALYCRCIRAGMPAMLVTWDGIYPLPKWRTPPNIFRRGDQSNMVTYFVHSDNWERQPLTVKRFMSEAADGKHQPDKPVRTAADLMEEEDL